MIQKSYTIPQIESTLRYLGFDDEVIANVKAHLEEPDKFKWL